MALHPHTLVAGPSTALLVIDVQERFMPAIFEPERVIQNTARLLIAARLVNLPVFVTQQYTKGLGPTVPELEAIIDNAERFEKMHISVLGDGVLLPRLRARGIQTLIVCGIETHVCVNQSVLGLMAEGFSVQVVEDACSSRTEHNHAIGIKKMVDAGAVLSGTEMALFELSPVAGTPVFRELQTLAKKGWTLSR